MRRPLSLLALLVACLVSICPASAQALSGPFTVVETGKAYAHLDDAVSDIRDGTAMILIAPGTYHDCTVQTGGRITYKAATPGAVIFDGGTCEGKAAFVLRGHESTVDGIVFRNMNVDDGNGAGIRIETGDLHVVNAMFLDSQEGILGGYPNDETVTVDHSTFSGLGQCDQTPDCAHSIYLANKGQVTITNSRFERGRGGHYVKLRVPHVTITDNSFDDTAGHKTNYMIDLPDGATGLIAHNTFVQGKDKENWSGFIVVGAEAHDYSSAGLRVEGNKATLAPGNTHTPAFVADLSHQAITVAGNTLGSGIRRFEER